MWIESTFSECSWRERSCFVTIVKTTGSRTSQLKNKFKCDVAGFFITKKREGWPLSSKSSSLRKTTLLFVKGQCYLMFKFRTIFPGRYLKLTSSKHERLLSSTSIYLHIYSSFIQNIIFRPINECLEDFRLFLPLFHSFLQQFYKGEHLIYLYQRFLKDGARKAPFFILLLSNKWPSVLIHLTNKMESQLFWAQLFINICIHVLIGKCVSMWHS